MHSQHFSLGQLRSLADRCGVALIRESPLAELIDVAPAPLDDMPNTGQLPLWREALACVARPRGRVRVVTPGAAATKSAAFYVADYGQLVGCWPERGQVHLSFPYTVAQLARAASDLLASPFPWPAEPVTVTLGPAGLAMLAAAVDGLKARRLAALLDRRLQNQPWLLSTDELKKQWEQGRQADDGRWMVTLLELVSPVAMRPASDPTEEGLNELARLELLHRRAAGWEPAEGLHRLALTLANPLPALTHEVILMHGAQPLVYRCALAMRGEGPLWLAEFQGVMSGQPQVALRSLTHEQYHRWLVDQHLSTEVPVIPAVSAPSATGPIGKSCRDCGYALTTAARFCSNCGQRVERQLPPPATTPMATGRCLNPSCGSLLKPGKRFCEACGTPVGTTAPPSSRFCVNPACSQLIAAGKRFCTQCGTPCPL